MLGCRGLAALTICTQRVHKDTERSGSPLMGLLTHTAEISVLNCLDLSSQKRLVWLWRSSCQPCSGPGLQSWPLSPLAPLGRQEECACLPMAAVNEQLPLGEKQQARGWCPHRRSWCLGWASVELCQSYHWRQEKGVFCPHQGLKQREPKQLVTDQFGPEYHSWECRLFSRSFSFVLVNNVVLERS